MYSNDPHYRELVAILAEILSQAQPVPGEPGDPAPMEMQEARQRRAESPVPDPVPLIVQPCETPQ